MARTAYTDLTLSFSIGANTDPNTTTAAAYIVDLYKQCYKVGYGDMELYSVTDANIDAKISDAFNQIVKDAAQRIFEEITESYTIGGSKTRPQIKLDDWEKMECIMAIGFPMRMSSHEDEDEDQIGDGVY